MADESLSHNQHLVPIRSPADDVVVSHGPPVLGPPLTPDCEPRSTGLTYLLWALCALGLCGMHRLYLGKTFSGILYLFTFGLFGVGQLVDVFRIPQLVRQRNVMSLGERVLAAHSQAWLYQPSPAPALAAPQDRDERLRQLLLQAAARHGGRLSVTQGVAATGVAFAEVEAILNDMVQSGYVGVDNDPNHGALVYVFGEL